MSPWVKRICFTGIVAALTAAMVTTVRAQDTNAAAATTTSKPAKPAAAKKESKAPKELKFSGKVGAIDGSAMTVTLDDSAKHVYQITSETLIFNDGKPAILTDGKAGDPVHGTAKSLEGGKLSALTLSFGAKAETPKPASKPKKKEKAAAETNAPAPPVAPSTNALPTL
jgi:Cu/Ag efflux protein CusF